MARAFGATGHRRRPAINITSLIDVMFLLLIFFMVSSTFRDSLGIDITLPVAQTGEEQSPSNYEITVKSGGELHFGASETPISPDELRTALEELYRNEPEAIVILRADEAAPFQAVITVVDTARAVGGSRLIIPTQAAQDTSSPLNE
jgi:biopolymer transport protein ExbD